MSRLSWPQYGLALARVAASRSEDPYRQVGAIIFRWDWSILSIGYNGAPPKIEINWDDREQRRDYVIHAEMNALRYAQRADTQAGALVSTHHPCERCLPMIAAYGLEYIYYGSIYEGHDEYDSYRLAVIGNILGLRIEQIKEHNETNKTRASMD